MVLLTLTAKRMCAAPQVSERGPAHDGETSVSDHSLPMTDSHYPQGGGHSLIHGVLQGKRQTKPGTSRAHETAESHIFHCQNTVHLRSATLAEDLRKPGLVRQLEQRSPIHIFPLSESLPRIIGSFPLMCSISSVLST